MEYFENLNLVIAEYVSTRERAKMVREELYKTDNALGVVINGTIVFVSPYVENISASNFHELQTRECEEYEYGDGSGNGYKYKIKKVYKVRDISRLIFNEAIRMCNTDDSDLLYDSEAVELTEEEVVRKLTDIIGHKIIIKKEGV